VLGLALLIPIARLLLEPCLFMVSNAGQVAQFSQLLCVTDGMPAAFMHYRYRCQAFLCVLDTFKACFAHYNP